MNSEFQLERAAPFKEVAKDRVACQGFTEFVPAVLCTNSTCQKLASASFQRSMGQNRLQLAGGMLVLACGIDGFAPLAPTITTCARPTCMPRLPRPHKLFMGRPGTETRTRRGSPRKEGSAKTNGIGAIVSGAMLLLAAPELLVVLLAVLRTVLRRVVMVFVRVASSAVIMLQSLLGLQDMMGGEAERVMDPIDAPTASVVVQEDSGPDEKRRSWAQNGGMAVVSGASAVSMFAYLRSV